MNTIRRLLIGTSLVFSVMALNQAPVSVYAQEPLYHTVFSSCNCTLCDRVQCFADDEELCEVQYCSASCCWV